MQCNTTPYSNHILVTNIRKATANSNNFYLKIKNINIAVLIQSLQVFPFRAKLIEMSRR